MIATVAAVALALPGTLTGVRQAASKTPVDVPPLEMLWHLSLPTPDDGRLVPRIAAGNATVFVVSPGSGVTARAATDGHVVWSSPLAATLGPVVAGLRVAVATPESLHVLTQETGQPVWTSPLAAGTSALFAFGGRFASLAGTELRAWDAAGEDGWRAALAAAPVTPMVFRNGVVYAGLDSTSLAAIDATTGAPRWSVPLRAKPESLAATDDRLYIGAADGVLYSYGIAGDDEPAWRFHLLRAIGQPVVDGRLAYFSLLDNTVSAFDRTGGTKRWSSLMPTRPFSGPFQMGGRLAVPLSTGGVVELDPRDGKIVTPAATEPAAPRPGVRMQAAVVAPDGGRLYTLTIGRDYTRTLSAWGRRTGK